MYKSILKFKKEKSRLENQAQNIDNGNDAEIFAASQIVLAIGAEVSWGSRNEDGRKIDIICSYEHPWVNKERLIFFVQVKSGASYGILIDDGIKLYTGVIDAVKKTTHAICVIWIDRANDDSYWAYIHPRTESRSQKYGKNHLILPTMRFDIARCQAQFLPVKEGGAGIILNEKDTDLKIVRSKALNKYRDYQTSGLYCPNLGQIEVTRIGWRHMFRKTRSSKNKFKSLVAIKFLDKIISDLPSATYISRCEFYEKSKYDYRNCEYVLVYTKVKEQGDRLKQTKYVVRVIEEIRWPKDWRKNSTLTQFVERRLVLLSCYYK